MNTIKFIVFCLLLVLMCPGLQAQDAKQFVQQSVNSELEADRNDHSHWLFHEVDRKPGNNVTQWVAQTGKGDVKRVLVRNGQPVPEQQQKQEVDKFIHDTRAQAQQRQQGQQDDQQAERLLKLLPAAFIWTETSHNGETTTLHFKPDPHFNPPNREARVFSAMEGDMMVNTTQHRIQSLKGKLIRDVTFGWGLLGRLKQGGWFDVERQEIGKGIWQITWTQTHIQGRALLFKTISEIEDDEKTSFERLPDDVSLEQAASVVMAKKDSGVKSGGQ